LEGHPALRPANENHAMTIICKRCEKPKHRVHFYDSDIANRTNICRACRKEYGKSYKPKPAAVKELWAKTNHRFFGEAVRDADDALRVQIRQMRRIAT